MYVKSVYTHVWWSEDNLGVITQAQSTFYLGQDLRLAETQPSSLDSLAKQLPGTRLSPIPSPCC